MKTFAAAPLTWPLTCVLGLLLATACPAEPWNDPLYHLTMDEPNGWSVMDAALLAKANAGVSHVTGSGFIGGYSATPADTLMFPYVLIQFKAYDLLPERDRPVAKLDTTGQLELIARITRAFDIPLPLSEDTDLTQFQQQSTSRSADLLALTEDGRFDFAGSIPLEDQSADIRYHSHGVIGRNGIAIVTLFTTERFDAMGPVIQGPMRTLAFAEGHRYADLPDEPPLPEPQAIEDETAEPPSADLEPETSDAAPIPGSSETSEPAVQDVPLSDAAPAEQRADDQANTVMLVVVGLGVLGVVIALVVVLVMQRQARVRRERAAARRERLKNAGR